jgi:hypothetical protein
MSGELSVRYSLDTNEDVQKSRIKVDISINEFIKEILPNGGPEALEMHLDPIGVPGEHRVVDCFTDEVALVSRHRPLDEGVLKDGRKVSGELVLEREERRLFVQKGIDRP